MEKVEHMYGDGECQCLSSIQHRYMSPAKCPFCIGLLYIVLSLLPAR